MIKSTIRTEKFRVYSLDFARGLVVALSAFLSNIPYGEQPYTLARHAQWNGITIIDFILPAFVTLFGLGIAFAYRNGVNWYKLIRRTILLIIYGLVFNSVVDWGINLDTLRFTGVLQLYSILGIVVVLFSRIFNSWKSSLLMSFLILGSYSFLLIKTSSSFPQPSFNLSGQFDPLIFGLNHIYQQGNLGHDPEGIFTIYSAIASVLIGYAAGKIILSQKKTILLLTVLGIVLLSSTPLLQLFCPIIKRIWSPAFVTLTSGTTILLVALGHFFFDQSHEIHNKSLALLKSKVLWFFEAFGRNSFLVYFGKFLLVSFMTNITIPRYGLSTKELLLNWVTSWSSSPQLIYATIIFLFWTLLTFLLHWKKIYLKV